MEVDSEPAAAVAAETMAPRLDRSETRRSMASKSGHCRFDVDQWPEMGVGERREGGE